MKLATTIIPFKVINAIFSVLIFLLAFEISKGSVEIGLTALFYSLGNMISSIYWGRKAFLIRNKIKLVLIGYLGLIASLYFSYLASVIYYVYISALLFGLFSNAIYFSLLSLITKRQRKRIPKLIGKFESVGGWAWIVGLIIGFVLRSVIDIRTFFGLMIAMTLFGMVYSIYVIRKSVIKKLVRKLGKEGLLPIIEESTQLLQAQEERAFKKIVWFSQAVRYQWPNFKFITPRISRKNIKLHFAFFVLFLAFGLVYPQYITLLKEKKLDDSLVFALTTISSLLSAIYYKHAGTIKKVKNTLWHAIASRSILYILLIASLFFYDIPFLFLMVFFQVVDGISWAFIAIPSNSWIMKKSKKMLGVNNFYRVLGYMLGSLASGYLVSSIGFWFNFASAALIVLISATLISRVKL